MADRAKDLTETGGVGDAVGRQKRAHSVLDLERARAMHATLDRPGPAPEAGAPLPAFWHYAWFWDIHPPGELGRDGHPRTGAFIPDLGLKRRMWAGGRLDFLHPARLGEAAELVTTIDAVQRKQGRSGPLGLVTLRQELVQDGAICLREWRDLIYRDDPAPDVTQAGAPPDRPHAAPQAPTGETYSRALRFDPTLLFRYSALTFNGHRIHYDRDYCQRVEGYPGLVVHGPLLAQRLMDLAQDLRGPLRYFRFRATAPLFDFETAQACARESAEGLVMWVRGPDGRQCMTAQAGFA